MENLLHLVLSQLVISKSGNMVFCTGVAWALFFLIFTVRPKEYGRPQHKCSQNVGSFFLITAYSVVISIYADISKNKNTISFYTCIPTLNTSHSNSSCDSSKRNPLITQLYHLQEYCLYPTNNSPLLIKKPSEKYDAYNSQILQEIALEMKIALN